MPLSRQTNVSSWSLCTVTVDQTRLVKTAYGQNRVTKANYEQALTRTRIFQTIHAGVTPPLSFTTPRYARPSLARRGERASAFFLFFPYVFKRVFLWSLSMGVYTS